MAMTDCAAPGLSTSTTRVAGRAGDGSWSTMGAAAARGVAHARLASFVPVNASVSVMSPVTRSTPRAGTYVRSQKLRTVAESRRAAAAESPSMGRW